MGGDMTRRLLWGKHEVVAYDTQADKACGLVQSGAEFAASLPDLVNRLDAPRTLWLMLPAGEATESTMQALMPLLVAGDVMIDGGNSYYKDTLRRAAVLQQHGLHLVDVGTSGGVWGLKEGYCLMVGGEDAIVGRLHSIFESLAPARDKGWGHVGPVGAGHFAKMVHNGIEYGLMQAYAEGFEILHARKDMHFDLHQLAEIWRNGAVIRSWLLDLTAAALEQDAELTGIADYVPDSGEGRWAVSEAIDLDVPAPIITQALLARISSRQTESYAAKMLAVMRHQFGGHSVGYGTQSADPSSKPAR